MSRSRILRIFLATALVLLGAVLCLAVEVGSGAPSEGLTQKFVNAFFRNGFAYLVTLPPVANVQRFGSTGLIQEFREAGGGNGRLALVKANQTTALPTDGSVEVAQVLANMFSYYSTVGVNTAGYPTVDTLICPTAAPAVPCQYQFFNKNYVLFAYESPTFNGQTFAVRDPFYTKWVAIGGIDGAGPATDIERNVTVGGTNATVQLYAKAAIYNITSGTLTGRVLAVAAPVYAAYLRAGGHDGFLGLPTSDDVTLTSGGHRQTFQGGNLDYTVGSEPGVRLPVESLAIIPYNTAPFQMKLGETLRFHVNLFTASGASLTDRAVTWVTTNNRVVTIEPVAGSLDAVAKAVGAGSAIISAVSEGKISPTVRIQVTAPCCQIGEGAPTPIIQQAIQDAVSRNRLSIALPAKSPAQRIGLGYVQELFSNGSPAVRYLIAKPDQSASAFVVTGNYLVRYEQLGGATGSLGYPLSDPGAHQLFQNASALAGGPVCLVTGAILAKWAQLDFENGAAGVPTSEAIAVVASSGNRASRQTFAKGIVLAATTGPDTAAARFVSGRILDRYNAIGGPAGAFGLPTSDEFTLDGRRRQDFEAGYIDFGPGDAAAVEHGAARRPAVSSNPSGAVVAGSRLRLSVTGFTDGSPLRVSITEQPDFVVTAPNGSYSWETYVPLSAPSRTFAIHAVDTRTGATADGSYTVKSLTESRLQLVKVQGDGQTAAPGAHVAQKLRAELRDENGTPVIGVPITFAASSGGQIVPLTAITDEAGQAEASLRLPFVEGLALATAEAARLVTTFSARATAVSLTNFPTFRQSDAPHGGIALGKGTATVAEKGALLTATAAIVRYHQNRSELAGALVDPGSLNQFLKDWCDGDLCDGFLGSSSEQVVNLWRIAPGVDVSVETPDVSTVRDLVSLGFPVLLALSLTANGAPGGGHYVVASGVTAAGEILIHDPNPIFGRTRLNEYLTGFAASGSAWQAALTGAIRLAPRTRPTTAFLAAAISQPAPQLALDVASINGACGRIIDLPDVTPPLISRFRYCDGGQPVYQVSFADRAALIDLAPGGRRTELGAGAYKATRAGVQLAVVPQDVSFSQNGIVNAADFAPGVAPGGLVAIFGSGLSGPAPETVVEINGVAAKVIFQSPYQIYVQVPVDLAPGSYSIRVRSPYGTAAANVELQAAAPAIFIIPGKLGQSARGAAVNQDGAVNGPLTPARRGQVLTIYCTGLGAVTASGNLFRTQAPVTAILNGSEIRPSFAGLTPGFIGLYQVNLPIPAAAPPGLDLPLLLREFERDSNTVFVAIQ